MGDILKELLPRKARLVVYLLVTLAVLAYGAWEAADGNVLLFVGSLFVALQSAMAASNVNPADPEPAGEPALFEYGLTQVSDKALLGEVLARGKLIVDAETAESIPDDVKVEPVPGEIYRRDV